MRNTEEAIILTHVIILTKACRATVSPGSQNDSQGVYCGLSTASEVFLIFTTQQYSYMCNFPAIVFVY